LCSITVKGDEPYLNGSQSNLVVNSLGHVLQVYINGKIAGTAREDSTNSFVWHLNCGSDFLNMGLSCINQICVLRYICVKILTGSAQGSASSSLISWQKPIELVPGKNKIDLLSATVGLSVNNLHYGKHEICHSISQYVTCCNRFYNIKFTPAFSVRTELWCILRPGRCWNYWASKAEWNKWCTRSVFCRMDIPGSLNSTLSSI
jgi:hypothetical protein